MTVPTSFVYNGDYFSFTEHCNIENSPVSQGLEKESVSPATFEEFDEHLLFEAQWLPEHATSIDPFPRVGIGYISSSGTAYTEALEDAFYLSRVLGGPLVIGIINPSNDDSPSSTVARMLAATWSRFFSTHPLSEYLQYYHGDGGKYVERALEFSEHKANIFTVGINSNTVIEGEKAFSFRNYGEIKTLVKGSANHPKMVSLPWFLDSTGSFQLRFCDPIFLVALQITFSLIACSGNRFVLGNILGQPGSCSSLIRMIQKSKFPQQQCFESHTVLSRQRRMEMVVQVLATNWKLAIDGEESWPERRLDHFFRSTQVALRLQDYVTAFFIAEHVDDMAITAYMIFFSLYWGIYSVLHVVLCAYRHRDGESSVQRATIFVDITVPAVNFIEMIFNGYLMGCGSGIHGVLASHSLCLLIQQGLGAISTLRQGIYTISKVFLGVQEDTVPVSVKSETKKMVKVGNGFPKRVTQQRIFQGLCTLILYGLLSVLLKVFCLEKVQKHVRFHEHESVLSAHCMLDSGVVHTYSIVRGVFVSLALVALIFVVVKARCCHGGPV